MDTAELIVIVGGMALIAFVLWFFFGPKRTTAARRAAGGVQEVDVVVRGAYTPDRIEVEAGRPVRVNFVREEANACTAEVVFPDLSLVKELPVGQRVAVEFTPAAAGEYAFHCGMNMVRGRVIVTPPRSREAAEQGEERLAAHH